MLSRLSDRHQKSASPLAERAGGNRSSTAKPELLICIQVFYECRKWAVTGLQIAVQMGQQQWTAATLKESLVLQARSCHVDHSRLIVYIELPAAAGSRTGPNRGIAVGQTRQSRVDGPWDHKQEDSGRDASTLAVANGCRREFRRLTSESWHPGG